MLARRLPLSLRLRDRTIFTGQWGRYFTTSQVKILRLIAQSQPKISNVRQGGQREILLEIFRKYWFYCTIDIVQSFRDEKIMLLLYRFQKMLIWYL